MFVVKSKKTCQFQAMTLTGKSCAGRRGVLVPIVLLEARELVRAEEG